MTRAVMFARIVLAASPVALGRRTHVFGHMLPSVQFVPPVGVASRRTHVGARLVAQNHKLQRGHVLGAALPKPSLDRSVVSRHFPRFLRSRPHFGVPAKAAATPVDKATHRHSAASTVVPASFVALLSGLMLTAFFRCHWDRGIGGETDRAWTSSAIHQATSQATSPGASVGSEFGTIMPAFCGIVIRRSAAVFTGRRANPTRVRAFEGASRAASGPLRRLPLGSSGLEVTDACLGTMTWGIQNSEEEAHAQLDYALKERGVNFVDTAEMYPVPGFAKGYIPGRTEEIIGSWLTKNTGSRQDMILATKVSGFKPKSKVASNRTVPRGRACAARHDPASIHSACTASLRRLKTDYIDLYQLHWPDRYAPTFGNQAYDPSRERADAVPFSDTVQAIKDLIAQGKVRHWGLSNETPYGVCEWVRACDEIGAPRPVSIQNPFSLLNRDFEGALAECCAPSHYNIGLLPWSPLGGGVLTGKYLGGASPSASRFSLFPRFQQRFQKGRGVSRAVEKYARIADEFGVSMTSLALQWCQSRWYCNSTIFGATGLDQLRENIDAFDGHVTPGLPAELLTAIDRIHASCKDPCISVGPTSLPGLRGVPGREGWPS